VELTNSRDVGSKLQTAVETELLGWLLNIFINMMESFAFIKSVEISEVAEVAEKIKKAESGLSNQPAAHWHYYDAKFEQSPNAK